MKVTVVGQWTRHVSHDASKMRGNISSVVVLSDPVEIDRTVIDIVGYAQVVYVIDHVRRQIRLLGSTSGVLPILAGASNHAFNGCKILRTIDVEDRVLQNYDEFVSAVNESGKRRKLAEQ